MTRAALAIAAALAAGGCARDTIDVKPAATDYNRKGLLAAIDKFTAAGKSAAAYGQLAADVLALRGGMDETVAAEAELNLTVLALAPVEAAHDQPRAARAAALATTVWSVGLADAIEAPDPQRKDVERGAPAKAGEAADAYLERLCGRDLAVECMFVVPEAQADVVEAVATRKFALRARRAVEDCLPCAGDPAWNAAVARWDALEVESHVRATAALEAFAPSRWPVAGAAAGGWAAAPWLDVSDDGGWQLDGAPVAPDARGTALAATRGDAVVLDVRISPVARADVLAAVVAAAAAAGYREVDVEARAPAYPWTRRAYHVAAGGRGHAPPWRPVDTVQVLLRSIDAYAAAGELVHL